MHLVDPEEQSEDLPTGRDGALELLGLLIRVNSLRLVFVDWRPLHARAVQVGVVLKELQALVAAFRSVEQISE